ncbi:MAG: L-serine ammonia-lyase [Clostridiales bacterium]|nr:L-serine ammonia-lyase [Clostridiales bacterium]
MKTLRELYRIGKGPSSSHTIGVQKACEVFSLRYPTATSFEVCLLGSLAVTGKGHGTEDVIISTLNKPVKIYYPVTDECLYHPNTLDLVAYDEKTVLGKNRFYSIGGGEIEIDGEEYRESEDIYSFTKFEQIKNYCNKLNIRLYDYVIEREGQSIRDYLSNVWQQMKKSIEEGLSKNGLLPGPLKVQRKAKWLLKQGKVNESSEMQRNRLICAYAFAVAEENASFGTVVTAPTCGSCGVLPSVLYYMYNKYDFSEEEIINALMTAGLIGNLIKENASISGAECGCQAEIGSASAMAAAALTELFKLSVEQTEYAAELSIEHQLGLTCDPVLGYVQIPCIERNAVAAMRAVNAWELSEILAHTRKVSLDVVIKTMYQTGKDMSKKYRETAKGGLAKYYKVKNKEI